LGPARRPPSPSANGGCPAVARAQARRTRVSPASRNRRELVWRRSDRLRAWSRPRFVAAPRFRKRPQAASRTAKRQGDKSPARRRPQQKHSSASARRPTPDTCSTTESIAVSPRGLPARRVRLDVLTHLLQSLWIFGEALVRFFEELVFLLRRVFTGL